MKKNLLFMFLLSFSIFAWEKYEIVDQFGDGTGKYVIAQMDNKNTGFFRLLNSGIEIFVDDFISSEFARIYIKIDTDEPIEINNLWVAKNHIIQILDDEYVDSIKKMLKKGKTLKISICDDCGNKITSRTYSATGFSSMLKYLK